MQLSPVYGSTSLVDVGGDLAAIGPITIRQRRRFVAALADLDADAWTSPTRCEAWTPRDVASHLDSATGFWTMSIRRALAGEPTRYLASFDPVSSPAEMAAADPRPADEVLEGLAASTEALAEVLATLVAGDWERLAEAPPGHMSISALVHHGHWDAWTHERDVLVPLGLDVPVLNDEVEAALRYVIALGPALAIGHGAQHVGSVEVRASDPTVHLRVDVGDIARSTTNPEGAGEPDLVVSGDALDLVEQLSVRRPITPEVEPARAWLLGGLAAAFDQPVD